MFVSFPLRQQPADMSAAADSANNSFNMRS